jgi:ABC-type branched-subunit amino acid transport system ATPase component
MSLADRVYFMTKGKVVYSDTRHNLEGKQEVFVRYLGVEV